MKDKTIRRTLLISTLLISMFSIFLIMGLTMGFIRPLWLALVLGANILLILFNSVMLGVTGTDKIWWDSKDELDNQIETYKRKCIAYERAREDLIQVQLKYHYDNASEEYDVTLKKLKD